MDRSLENQPFNFVRRSLLAVDGFHKENLWVQRLHSMVIQTIFYFKMKVCRFFIRKISLLNLANHWEAFSMSGLILIFVGC